MKRQRYLKHIFIIILIAVVLPASAGATVYLGQPDVLKMERGKVRSAGPHGILTIKRPTKADFSVTVGPDAAITRDGEVTGLENIHAGDVVNIQHLQGIRGGSQTVVKVEAEAGTIIGEIVGFDQETSEVTILARQTRTFKIGHQTVIMLNGALAGLIDVKPGVLARAELDDETGLTIARLKLTR